ncbi:MAG: HIT family protein [Nanoarchaeota archaeon]|nr:HIT family protein [Nanoarchaeota archaeon]
MLTPEQITQIKDQLFKQLENFPEEQRESARTEIESMDAKQLEEFLTKNKMLQEKQTESPFRLIIQGKIPSYKLAENEDAIAVLEINPISKGHCIIISKSPLKKLSEKTNELAKNTALILKQKLSAKDVLIANSEIFDETIINLLPVYNNENFESPRQKATPDELKKLQEELTQPLEKTEEHEKPKPVKKPRKIPLKKLPKAPKRIP